MRYVPHEGERQQRCRRCSSQRLRNYQPQARWSVSLLLSSPSSANPLAQISPSSPATSEVTLTLSLSRLERRRPCSLARIWASRMFERGATWALGLGSPMYMRSACGFEVFANYIRRDLATNMHVGAREREEVSERRDARESSRELRSEGELCSLRSQEEQEGQGSTSTRTARETNRCEVVAECWGEGRDSAGMILPERRAAFEEGGEVCKEDESGWGALDPRGRPRPLPALFRIEDANH